MTSSCKAPASGRHPDSHSAWRKPGGWSCPYPTVNTTAQNPRPSVKLDGGHWWNDGAQKTTSPSLVFWGIMGPNNRRHRAGLTWPIQPCQEDHWFDPCPGSSSQDKVTDCSKLEGQQYPGVIFRGKEACCANSSDRCPARGALACRISEACHIWREACQQSPNGRHLFLAHLPSRVPVQLRRTNAGSAGLTAEAALWMLPYLL